MQITLNGQTVNLFISRRYPHAPRQTSIEAFCVDGEPYGALTKFVHNANLSENETVIDTNNVKEALDVLVEKKIVEFTGRTVTSGHCQYPVARVLAQIC